MSIDVEIDVMNANWMDAIFRDGVADWVVIRGDAPVERVCNGEWIPGIKRGHIWWVRFGIPFDAQFDGEKLEHVIKHYKAYSCGGHCYEHLKKLGMTE